MNFIKGPIAAAHGADTIGVRPEHIEIKSDAAGMSGEVRVAEHLGSDTFAYVMVPDVGQITVRTSGEFKIKDGDKVNLVPDPARIHRFDKDGKAIARH
jgi:multiple sugar transport system ATP-binding protein